MTLRTSFPNALTLLNFTLQARNSWCAAGFPHGGKIWKELQHYEALVVRMIHHNDQMAIIHGTTIFRVSDGTELIIEEAYVPRMVTLPDDMEEEL